MILNHAVVLLDIIVRGSSIDTEHKN